MLGKRGLPGWVATGAVISAMLPSVLYGAPATGEPQPAAVEPIEIIAPAPGAWVTGVVKVQAKTQGPTVAVLFEVSLDKGDTWAPIALDEDSSDGWRAQWDSLEYNGPAALRASKVGADPVSDAVNVKVDNEAPRSGLTVRPSPFSPNHDGRRDKARIKLRTNEPTRAHIEVRRGGRVWKRWNRSMSGGQRRSLVWSGDTFRSGLPDGRYRIVAEVSDRAGLSSSASDEVVVDRTRPKLGPLRLSPKPSSDPGRIRIRYRTRDRSEPLSVRARIVGGGGTLSSKRDRVNSGQRSTRLRARYSNGEKLFPGQYRVQLRVTDAAGNRSARSRPWYVHRSMKGRVFQRLENTGRKVALTFDDCYDDDAWSRILTTLKRSNVRATFFCNGVYVKQFAHLSRRTVRDGHTIGSHSWDHAVLAFRSPREVRWRLLADRRAWIEYGGATSAPYFRPPYGSWDRNTVTVAGETSHPRVMMWDVDSGDTSGASGSTLVCNVVCESRPGSIVLLHAKDVTSAALPDILSGLRRRNLKPVTLAKLFSAAGYR